MKARKLTKETVLGLGVENKNYPEFNVGDTIVVATRVKEGAKERIQNFQGDVIALHNHGIASTFTIRKMGANSISVERIFPFHSPIIDSIEIVKRGKVRRAKLYYLRDRVGRAAKIREDITKKKADAAKKVEANEAQQAS